MAVTKIRKLSSWTLLIISIISVIVLGIFFGGGVEDPSAEIKNYIYTGLLLDWTYIVFAVTLVALAVLALWQFASVLKTNPKSALRSLIVVVLFALLLIITYSMGDGTPLTTLNADSQTYNTPFWLKATDMWIQSSVVLFIAIILVVCAGTVKRILNK
jgi:hydrogenase-4 membrane subunit HyfE